MTLDEELQRIPKLTSVGRALVQFTMSLTKGSFVRERRRWVYRPPNFVTFCVQHARAQTIALSLCGNWRKFKEDPVLCLSVGRNTMRVQCIIDSPRQLAAASSYIEHAFKVHSQSPRQARKYKASVRGT
jgi:hypothetical protein